MFIIRKWSDLREWLKEAESIGEVKTLRNVDPVLELSAIAQVDARNQGPALLFDDIKGYEGTGMRVLTNSIANTKLFNLTFGGDVENSLKQTVEGVMGKPNKWQLESSNYPVNYVDSGPVMENIEEGDKIDLTKFPAPKWHDEDGGRFIGTGVAVITRDPETGLLNSGSYRAQLYDKNSVGLNIGKGKHGAFHRDKYYSEKSPMPVVMVFGPDPLMYALAGSEIPTGVSELEYQGAVQGKSVDVIKGKYTDLPIPANAELVIEGFSYPGKTKLEGPHGEWTGYYASDAIQKPYVEVKAVYYRNNPIIVGAAMSKGGYNDHAFWRGVWKSALIYDEMVKNGLPGLKGVYCPPFGVGRQFINVSIKQGYPGHATEAGYLASQTRSAAYMGKWVVVVDEDVDPYDMDDVLWAICSRSEPSDMGVIKRAWASSADPLRPKDVPGSKHMNSRGIIFAVVPYERMDTMHHTCIATEERRKDVFDRWSAEFGSKWSKY